MAMKVLINLELRKQSKTFLGLLFIIIMCLTFITGSVSFLAGLQLGETFSGISLMIRAFGIPFFALILGASAGAALRSGQRKAEEDIPIRPSKRIFACYLASVTYLIFLATTLFVVSAPIDASIMSIDFLVPVVMLVLLPFHCAAFVFSYWLSQAILGGVISTMINIPSFALFPYWLYGGIYSNLLSMPAAPGGFISVFIQLSVVFLLANRIEREKFISLPAKIAIGVALAFSFLLSVVAMILLDAHRPVI
jgi:hypothetical protein